MIKYIYLFFVLLPSVNPQTVKPKNQDTQVAIVGYDNKMEVATAEARSTVHDFVRVFTLKTAEYQYFAVKYPFEDNNGGYEQIWLHDLVIKNDEITGSVADNPVLTAKVKYGDRITVKLNEISDWMYVKNDNLIGGFTIKALRAIMSTGDGDTYGKDAYQME